MTPDSPPRILDPDVSCTVYVSMCRPVREAVEGVYPRPRDVDLARAVYDAVYRGVDRVLSGNVSGAVGSVAWAERREIRHVS